MYDLILVDGTVIGECCHGSSVRREQMERYGIDLNGAEPYTLKSDDICGNCGWGPANSSEY